VLSDVRFTPESDTKFRAILRAGNSAKAARVSLYNSL